MGMYVPPQYGQGGGNSQNLVQLAMAVKSFKMQEKEQKRNEASQRIDMLMKNPQLLLMQDPKEMEKDLKAIGIKVTDKQPANPADAAKTAPPVKNPGTGDTPAANVNPANLASVNKSGAQSAAPASNNSAGKAPGGGVNQDPMANVSAMADKASARLKENYGALAPLYGGAQSQIDAAAHQAQLQSEIDTLKKGAIEGDIRSMARLSAIAGHQVTDSDMRNMVVAAGFSEKAVGQALDVALHNESGDSKATRYQAMSKDLMSNPQIMQKLENPLDVYKITNALVYGGDLPSISMKPFSLDELKEEADYEKTLMTEQNMPYGFSHLVARARTLGISPSQSLPPGLQGLLTKSGMEQPIAGRKAGALEKQASAAMLSAQAEMVKANTEHSKIKVTLEQKEYEMLNDRIRLMIEADKAKKPWPDEIKQGYLNQLARATGLMPEEVSHWYKFGMSTEYIPDPASDLAKAAAGGGPETPKGKKDKTLAESGGIVGAAKRAIPKDAAGNPILNPFELEHQLLTKGRDKALQYMKDIVFGMQEQSPEKP